ncbi:Asp23/Gls24 family envelope stress response protein [Streptomonospora wellingtoniae]|uniref:Alkaline shock response membrane anchor protein AmaP n=1 Tax=Streptomonospora wellingtoniae TaxID=3075544 RepID=A0ABU2KQN1_9ACTN|nr:alkaline shock response membrane anchor protein AmaP [Streptomonospora sp. DSM 45055]MDT0301580.1 alkaline shock response membrane anchor protein AmaP [Streptomonospora sp. DSM 45055]
MTDTPASTARRTSRGNRCGLVLVGTVLAAAGALALAAGSGLLGRRLADADVGSLPSGAAGTGTLLSYGVVAVSVLAGLLALRWMIVQGRSDAVGRLVVEPDSGRGATEMSAGAARGAFEEAVAAYDGVRRARARVTDSALTPHLRLDLTLADDADVADLWRRVRSEVLADLRTALDRDGLPTVVRMSTTAPPKRPRRTPQ